MRSALGLPLCMAVGMAASLAVGAAGSARAQSAAQQAALASAIPVQAGATIDRDSVTVGDVVRLTIRVRAPLGATVNFPAGVDSLGPVQSLEPPMVRSGSDSASAADRIAVYRLAPWDVGSLAIRLGEVLVQTDDGERRVALPLPVLFVRSVLPADTTLRVPKPARPLIGIRPPTPWWWWLLAAAALALTGAAWWWSRRRRQAAPTGDPFADAEREFTRIERLGLVAAGEPGRHAALMTDAMRRYLSARLTGVSLALTSTELLDVLRGHATVSPDRVRALLHTVDAVKFGRAPIGAAEARAAGDEAQAIVRAEHEQAARVAAALAAAARPGQVAA